MHCVVCNYDKRATSFSRRVLELEENLRICKHCTIMNTVRVRESKQDRPRRVSKAQQCASQNNQCAICAKPLQGVVHGGAHDHCHATGKMRGVLCLQCNAMLGFAKDNIQTLKNAIKYLELWIIN